MYSIFSKIRFVFIKFLIIQITFLGLPQIKVYAEEEASASETVATESAANQDQKPDCESESQEGKKDYIYKVGCDFNDDVRTIDKVGPDTWDTILTMINAIAAISSIFLKPCTAKSLRNPLDVATFQASMNLNRVAGVGLLVEEVATNIAFKENSKKAMDLTFEDNKDGKAQQTASNEEGNSEQLASTEVLDDQANTETNIKKEQKQEEISQTDAFNTLLELYKKQKEVMSAKLAVRSILEAAYIAALAIEVSMYASKPVKCESVRGGLKAALEGPMKSLLPCSATAAAEGFLASYRSASIANCGAAMGVESSNRANDTRWAFQLSVSWAGGTIVSIPLATAATAQDQTNSATETAKNTAAMSVEKGLLQTLAIGLGTLSAPLGVVTVPPPNPKYEPNCTQAVGALPAMIAEVQSTSEAMVDNCGQDFIARYCATDLVARDHCDEASGEVVNFSREKENSDELHYAWTQKVLDAFLYNLAYEKLLLGLDVKQNPQLVLSEHNVKVKKLNLIQNSLKEALSNKKLIAQKIMSLNTDSSNQSISLNFANKLSDLVVKMLQALSPVQTAKANWAGELMMSGGVLLMGGLMSKQLNKIFYRGYPNRIAAYSVFTATTAGLIAKGAVDLNKINKRIEIISTEKEKYINATTDDSRQVESISMTKQKELLPTTGSTEGDSEGNGSEEQSFGTKASLNKGFYDVSSSSESLTCATASGGSFNPVACRNLGGKRTNVELSMPNEEAKTKLGGEFSTALGMVATMGEDAMNHGQASRGMGPATFSQTEKLKAAMRKKLKEVLKEADERVTPLIPEEHHKELSPLALVDRANASINAAYEKSNRLRSVTPLISAPNKENESKKGEGAAQKSPTKLAAISNTYKANSKGFQSDTSKYDNGSSAFTSTVSSEENTKSSQEALKEYQVKYNDIAKTKETSLFKIISNRYIKSYNKILPKRK
jgi:hypothetical protein